MLPGGTAPPHDADLAARRVRLPAPAAIPDYPNLLQAPIFTPDRAPGESADAQDAAGAGPLFQLLGVALAGRASSAVIRAPDSAVNVLRLGQTQDGWRLVALSPDRATLIGASGKTVLVLGAADKTAAGANAAPPPTPEAK